MDVTVILGSLVSSPSLFFILQFVFTMIHRGGRAEKNGKGLVHSSHEVDMMGGRGALHVALRFQFSCSGSV